MFNKIIGILGGGQLGRMSALAAARLGMEVIIYCPEKGCPASFVSAGTYFADYDDRAALEEFAAMVDVVTYEFENIPIETIRFLQKFKPVYPDDHLLEIAQDRVNEKRFLNDTGLSTANWEEINGPEDIQKTMEAWNADSFILKTRRFGYDGKGQRPYNHGEDADEAWARLGQVPLIAESYVDFSCELSIIVARDKVGQTTIYGPMLNEHHNHILYKTTMPAGVNDAIALKAKNMAQLVAEACGLTGVLALEMFLTGEGDLLANEIAPRTHNSGHWSIDACAVSQFENHVRTITGLHVGAATRHSDVVMRNLIGEDVKEAKNFLESDHTCLHLYGKRDIRPGRKMGHVTLLKPIS